MNSNIKTVMQAIANNPAITADEIIDQTGMDRKQITKAIWDVKADGRVQSSKDPLTGMPCYKLTDEGRAFLGDCFREEDQQAVAENTSAKPPKPAAPKNHNPAATFAAPVEKPETPPASAGTTTKPLGYLVALPGSHRMHESEEAAMQYAATLLMQEGELGVMVCAVVAEAKAEIVWRKAA